MYIQRDSLVDFVSGENKSYLERCNIADLHTFGSFPLPLYPRDPVLSLSLSLLFI